MKMPTNTAEFREIARVAREQMRWDLAAACYQRAIDLYPESLRSGDLYRDDLKFLVSKRDSSLREAREPLHVCLMRFGFAA